MFKLRIKEMFETERLDIIKMSRSIKLHIVQLFDRKSVQIYGFKWCSKHSKYVQKYIIKHL